MRYNVLLVLVVLVLKNLPASAQDTRDTSSISGLGRSPRRGNGTPHQYSSLGNPMDGARQATVHGVTKSWTRLKQLSTPYNTVNQHKYTCVPSLLNVPAIPPL